MKHDPQASEDLYRDAGLDMAPSPEPEPDQVVDLECESIRTTILCDVCDGSGSVVGDECLWCGGTGEIEIRISEITP